MNGELWGRGVVAITVVFNQGIQITDVCTSVVHVWNFFVAGVVGDVTNIPGSIAWNIHEHKIKGGNINSTYFDAQI